MEKPIVFISHITEEKEVALALKKVFEKAFVNMMDVFVSSDPRSIHLGQEWLQKIKFALSHCAVEIIIASPQAVKRPWINFEAGSGWIRAVPVIPLCHSGMEPSKLPFPLKALQGATATQEEELNLVLPVLAEALGSGIPEIDFTEFINTVRGFEATTNANTAIVGSSRPVDDDGQALMPHELATFVAVAEQSDLDTPIPVWSVTNEAGKKGFTPIAVRLALKILERKELIILSKEPGDGYNNRDDYLAARVSDPGWVWLQENKENLVLMQPSSKRSLPADDIPF